MRSESDPAVIARKLEDFLDAESCVRIVEENQVRMLLAPHGSGHSVLAQGGKVVLHVWSAEGSLVRRVTELRENRRALRLAAFRLGQARSTPLWLEAVSPRSRRQPERRAFRDAVLEAIHHAWRPWRPVPAPGPAAASNLEFVLLQSRLGHIACVAVPPDAPRGEGALAALLLWARALRRENRVAEGVLLRLIVPAALASALQLRIAGLRSAPRIAVFTWEREAGLRAAAEANWGNLESVLPPPREFAPPGGEWFAPLAATVARECPGAACACGADGRVYFRLHGLTFLRQSVGPNAWIAPFQFAEFADRPPFRRQLRPLLPETEPAFLTLLRRLNRERRPDGDPRSPLYQLQPEAWMEELLRERMADVDSHCDPRFLYRQMPSFCQEGRDVLDLLAAHRDGRLCVFELKASAAAGFPLQALDYWLRVRRHLAAGDFTRRGFFPGLELRPDPPLLALVSPALQWHASLGDLLGELAPEIPVVLVGVNEQWRQGVRILERRGAGAAAAWQLGSEL